MVRCTCFVRLLSCRAHTLYSPLCNFLLVSCLFRNIAEQSGSQTPSNRLHLPPQKATQLSAAGNGISPIRNFDSNGNWFESGSGQKHAYAVPAATSSMSATSAPASGTNIGGDKQLPSRPSKPKAPRRKRDGNKSHRDNHSARANQGSARRNKERPRPYHHK